MNLADYHFLLLTSRLGQPERKPLSIPQLRLLASRVPLLSGENMDSELTMGHLTALGIDVYLAERTLNLLEDGALLREYLRQAERCGCFPIVRTNPRYPRILRRRLGADAPGCLWMKGDPEILKLPCVSAVGSRELRDANRAFAREVGRQAALQGYALVSGNARGADTAAQYGCLEAGGFVISILADSLTEHPERSGVLFVSEEDFDEDFSIPRALRRNRIIHCMGQATFVAQCNLERGGTWDGSTQNLRHSWSPLYCYNDGSPAAQELEAMGGTLVDLPDLQTIASLQPSQLRFE